VINGYGAGLYDQHAAMLEASKITPEQARARGYVSIDGNNRAMLAEIGIVKAARTDGLLIPLLRLDGSVAGYQHRPDNPRVKDGKEIKYETPYRQSNMIDFPPGVAERIQDRNVPIWITEGVKKGDAGACAGLAIVDIPGVWNWVGAGGVPLPDFRDLGLADREVILCFDSDTAVKPEVRKALTELAGWLKVSKRAKIKYCCLPHNGNKKTGLDDFLADGHTTDDLLSLVRPDLPKTTEATSDTFDGSWTPPLLPDPITLDEAHETFRHWLGAEYDLDALDVMLATVAVEKLTGDPIWLLLISGSGNAKTESVQALDGIGAAITSTISSPAALLSGTSRREISKDATGGLLRKLGKRGVLVIKDVTSLLSANRDARAEVMAAFREIYDGRWERNLGTDGGRTLSWRGRIAVVGAVTTAWDTAHDVIASMGDRFVLLRMDSTTGREKSGKRAIRNISSEEEMRRDLAAAVGGVLAGMGSDPAPIDEDEIDILLAAADLVTLSRTGVMFDYRGDVIDAHAPEMPTRFAKQLAQIVRGATAIGLPRDAAMRLAIRCARDSMPPLRLAIIDDLAKEPHSTVVEVRRRIDKPWSTVKRQLEALHMLDVLTVEEIEEPAAVGNKITTRWYYSLADQIDPKALDPSRVPRPSPDLLVHAQETQVSSTENSGDQTDEYLDPSISGDGIPTCQHNGCKVARCTTHKAPSSVSAWCTRSDKPI
jgi:hypothetical protein